MSDFALKYDEYVKRINEALDCFLPDRDDITVRSMRYSLFAGGKRVRPVICLAFCELSGADIEKAIPFACALEMIHTYSLIYDDFPCMDNDTLRRGKPTNHVVYGEAVALMAGVALYGEALKAANSAGKFGLSDAQVIAGTEVLLDASGLKGIITGQVLDMENRAGLDEDSVRKIHDLKTSSMLEASAILGVIAAGGSYEEEMTAVRYAKDVGLAFQIRDDILDVIGNKEDMGKTLGKDRNSNKTTFVDILGVESAQKRVRDLSERAKSVLPEGERGQFLRDLAEMLCNRTK